MKKLILLFSIALSHIWAQENTLIYQKDSLSIYSVSETQEYKSAKLRLTHLANKPKSNDMIVTFGIDSFTLKAPSNNNLTGLCANSKDGQHIHYITDNKPYTALYESFRIYSEDTGSHLLLSFLSRSHHQSLKHKSAYVLTQFDTYKKTKTYNLKAPYLFYSRPKGTYVDNDTKEVMLDFYIVNCQLSPNGHKVKVELDQKHTFYITKWSPYILKGLSLGTHSIKMTLIDSLGKKVATPFNPSERTFILQNNPK